MLAAVVGELRAEVHMQLVNTSGLLYNHLGDVYAYEKTWRILTNVDREDYEREFEEMRARSKWVKDWQEKYADKVFMGGVSYQLNTLIDAISGKNDLMFNRRTPPLRKKRAILPFIGSSIEWLFGNPDEDSMDEVIRLIKENKKEIRALSHHVANQTVITGKLADIIQSHFRAVGLRINEILASINVAIAEHHEVYTIQNNIDAITQTLTLAIIRVKSYQDKLLHHLLADEVTYVDPELVDWHYLNGIFETIESKLETGQMLPWKALPSANERLAGYKFVSMRTFAHKDNYVLEIYVPIISKVKKDLYEVIATPFMNGERMLYVSPESQYIITDKAKTEISFLNALDREDCWNLAHNVSVCPGSLPVYNRAPENNFCELALLIRQVNGTSLCLYHEMKPRNILVRIKDRDQYYFSFPHATHIYARCKGIRSEMTMVNTGMISITDGCMLINRDFTIKAQSAARLSNSIKFSNNMLYSPLNNSRNDSFHPIMVSSDFTQAEGKILELKKEIEINQIEGEIMLRKYIETDTPSSTVTFDTTMIIIIIIIIIVIYRRQLAQERGVPYNQSIVSYVRGEPV